MQFELNPLQVAIDSITEAKEQLKDVIEDSKTTSNAKDKSVKPLQLKLQGILSPAVMGGIANYERVFFTENYKRGCTPEELGQIDKLKDAIANLIPILELGLYYHAQRVPEDQAPFHDMILNKFREFKPEIESKYGRRVRARIQIVGDFDISNFETLF